VRSRLRRVVRQAREARRRAKFALGPSARMVPPLAGLAVVAGLSEAGVLALVAQAAFVLSQGEDAPIEALGPLSLGSDVPMMLGLAFVLALVRVGVQWALAWLTSRMASRTQSRLRQMLFHAYTGSSWTVQANDRGGQLQEMMTAQARLATNGAMVIAGALSPMITFAILVLTAVALSPFIAMVVAFAALGIFMLLRPFGRMTRKQAVLQSEASLRLAEGVGEAVHLTEEMQVFGTVDQHRAHVDSLVNEAEESFFRSQLLTLGVPTLHQGLALLLVISGLGGLYVVGAGDLGSLGAIVLLLVRSLSYAQQLQTSYVKLNDVVPFLDRMERDIDRYERARPDPGSEPVPSTWSIRFDQVTYRYRVDEAVLRDISFEVGEAETVGVIGPSGAGKSTLVQLLLRLREPDGGTYYLDGVDAVRIDRRAWQRSVALVSQEPRLLSGSVAENIRYYRDWLTDLDVERAARMAHIHDEILTWTGGYQHRVGQRLDAVSGGQRQRICMARALAGRPRLLVLDEPTSALDPRSEAAIQQSLQELRGAVTMFVVAHRMSTLSICDRIMVIADGRLEGFGTPAELWDKDPYFRSAMELSASKVGSRTAVPT
jgi:ATP-binding cassette subfamily B protein